MKEPIVDNFERLRELMDFSIPNTFYFGFIAQRRKENPEIGADNIIIKYYFFKDDTSMDKRMQEIKDLCKHFNARFYMNVNRRDYDKVSLECLSLLVDRFKTSSCKSNKTIWETSCGRVHSEPKKKWIIDVDTKDQEFIDKLKKDIETIQPEGEKVLCEFPTKNGVHLITCAFNVKTFGEMYPETDIQKNNPTFIYQYE